ncbi:hypothetical protein THMIRHAS_20140 [Thiosulfatimonas sediminis]|uniref:Transposase InsH N-terminal domain-containing protein n=1 Tax=Thiosulfatimonas sediminis TaxID=2675054 RepID=A0A6F8PWY9_9GAMM|nr:transposase [Thiosulfatimonas sediminis]BBP46641.1 hypothetical protein THMIRHAS_20140 [Thiosulfatimonas sediminis]
MTMKPKTHPKETHNRDLFRPLLCDIINPDHELTRLTNLIDWSQFDSWSDLFPSKTGRPATPPRLIAGLFYLQHLFGHSDEGVLEAYLQSPYYQYFVVVCILNMNCNRPVNTSYQPYLSVNN